MRSNPFVRKLEGFAPLSDHDKGALERVSATPRDVKADRDLIREGDTLNEAILMVEGFACRYKMLPDGRRQVLAYLLPGDVADPNLSILNEMDHSIGTLSPCKVAHVSRDALASLQALHPNIARALRWAGLVDEAITREWLANIGRRSADKRIAHLLCELLVRLQAVDLATDRGYDLPITQDELADTTGLSVVHVNRVLQGLRREGLIGPQNRRLEILDVARLVSFASFNPNYLHLHGEHEPRRQPARMSA